MKRFLTIAAASIAGSVAISAQTQPAEIKPISSGKFGIGLDGITTQNNLLLKYFVTENFAAQLIAGYDYSSVDGNAPSGQTKVDGSELRAGVSVLYHLSNATISPYVGVEGLFTTNTEAGIFTTEPDPTNALTASLVVGGEYFVHPMFSVGVKAQLGVKLDLERDIPVTPSKTSLFTATAVTARLYFN